MKRVERVTQVPAFPLVAKLGVGKKGRIFAAKAKGLRVIDWSMACAGESDSGTMVVSRS